jgi:diguanylate cyclase (GGDEF)-like protein
MNRANLGPLHRVKKDALLRIIAAFMAREGEWQEKLEAAQHLAYRDQLTGLYNFRYLEIALENEIKRATRFQQEFSLLFIDIDNFKHINDSHGHNVGNVVLQQLAQVISKELRDIDTVIRFGGDEYIVLLIGASPSAAAKISERLRQRVISSSFGQPERQIDLSISVGISSFPAQGRDQPSLLQAADHGMYREKIKLVPQRIGPAIALPQQ